MPKCESEVKIMVFIDQSLGHPKEFINLRNIHLGFLAPSTTAILQPMDQGIVSYVAPIQGEIGVFADVQQAKY
jgi:hypothetical protein